MAAWGVEMLLCGMVLFGVMHGSWLVADGRCLAPCNAVPLSPGSHPVMCPPCICLQHNIYLRNVNKVALFKRVIDRQEVKVCMPAFSSTTCCAAAAVDWGCAEAAWHTALLR